jgi:AcrR family transcriptional regulator
MAAAGRPNQRNRTRKDLLQAAARLLKQGGEIGLEQIAAEAMVSRATAYRYFPNVEALLVEAAVDVAFPSADEVFRGAANDDPLARLERADAAVARVVLDNEASLRRMLVHSLQQGLATDRSSELPARQNRRALLIDAALAPVRHQLKPAALDPLRKALALVIGTESMVVFKDVLRVDDAEARKVRRWALRALVDAARK